jgi:NTE family protein
MFSSVSGGSILNGLLAVRWPDLLKDGAGRFTNFTSIVEAPMRDFCSRNLRNQVLIADRLNPRNWLKLLRDDYSITNKLAEAYDEPGFLNGATLHQVSRIYEGGGPRFVFCATNMRTGVNWEFAGRGIGDYQTGRTQMPNLKLAIAVAASSAFPLAFPPLMLPLEDASWEFGNTELEDLEALRETAELTDGGVYDNMGLEPVWKGHDYVFCSDAGAPFASDVDPGNDFIRRLIRVNAIIDRQSRALRRRILIDAFRRGDYGGAFWGIGTNIEDYPLDPPATGYAGPTKKAIAGIRTDLNIFRPAEQLVLMNHGWLLSGAALRAHCIGLPQPSGVAPDLSLLDNDRALKALKS